MATKRKAFDKLFAQLQDIKDENGHLVNTVLWSKNGDCSVILAMRNPVPRFCTDAEQYINFTEILGNVIQTLGEGYALQKQDIFVKRHYHHEVTDDMEFLTKSYFRHFEGREYTDILTFLVITQEAQRNLFIKYDPKRWMDFHTRVGKVCDILTEKKIWNRKLTKDEVNEYLHRFMAFNFQEGAFSMQNFKAADDGLRMGDRSVKTFSLVDVDVIDLPNAIKPYLPVPVNGYQIATDLLGFMCEVPFADCIVYNQVIQIPAQQKLKRKLESKSKRHGSMPDPSNKIAKADIDTVLNLLAADNKLLVNTSFNIIVSCPLEKATAVTSFIETKLYGSGITPSKTAYNQLELFQCSFPGNAYTLNPDYDLFLTLSDAALCFCFKEYIKKTEDSPLLVYLTDRQGLPVGIDFTGKEGKVKHTNNANFILIGPSGAGKSFAMNSIVRQLIVQNTDIVLMDTGDSYSRICAYYGGTYITYSKEHPISMNPFKITRQEYEENFNEKKNSLMTLILFIYSKKKAVGDIEELIVNQTLVDYYEAYFHPFEKFSDEERENMRKLLILKDKSTGEYDKQMEQIKEVSNQETREYEKMSIEERMEQEAIRRRVEKLQNLANDDAASEGEKINARHQIARLTPELVKNAYLMRIDEEVDKMEEARRNLKVTSLSFNTYFEFAMERIPQICKENDIQFNTRDFRAILKRFYKGGELEYTLNNDDNESLFDQRFVVFEVDKIKEDETIFPIVVLIIMDVFLQKMRLKPTRKAIIIEEAWKAVATPRMAAYLQYLYKTVRKFNGIAGVVTQELTDLLSSEILKQAIVANSDITILMDHNKVRDNFNAMAGQLSINPVQRQQIFTINSLNNKENRPFFRELWIRRGDTWDVYGVEEPPECYWAYTTERMEKEALNIYITYYGDVKKAIYELVRDQQKSKIKGTLDFAKEVNKQQNVLPLWEN